ncbi:hypothetical protein JW777_08435 [bacterium]|nr:hypothetical protein [bacterium]
MKSFRFFSLILCASAALAADESPDVISSQGRVRIGGVYQSWSVTDTLRLSESSFPVEIYYPLNRNAAMTVSLGAASVTSGQFSSLSGISDAQVSANYYMEDRNLLLNLGIGLPTGKRELKAEEFATSIGLSSSFFNYRVPVFGQGFSISPGITWAKPLNDQTVLGLGASYQHKGGYVPMEGMKTYKQGAELLLTGGIDYQTSDVSAVSLDLTVTVYGKDVYDDADMMKSGAKVMAAGQYKQYMGYDLLWLFGRFRSRSKSVIYMPGTDAEFKMQRDEFETMVRYRRRLNPQTALNYSVEARYFFKTDEITQGYQAGVGFGPERQVSPEMKLKGELKVFRGRDYSLHDTKWLTGFEIGGGLEYTF